LHILSVFISLNI